MKEQKGFVKERTNVERDYEKRKRNRGVDPSCKVYTQQSTNKGVVAVQYTMKG